MSVATTVLVFAGGVYSVVSVHSAYMVEEQTTVQITGETSISK